MARAFVFDAYGTLFDVHAAIAHHRLDAVLSVDAIRIYKPRPEVYALASSHFKLAPADIIFVSSNRWDVMGAHAFGLRTAWVNRANAPEEYEARPGTVLADLSGLVAA